ncbi:translation elongation factor-like protein [Patescibacteria group bacterium]|nr:translation elongation factor-like protein [Patescibacteria group bacterium]MBU1966887.1 translation elongation factor-like protein [Patescibacteria group bacterium]MBU2543225.1 translation elongation factor-like protein [Patescibacteria group bacterium]
MADTPQKIGVVTHYYTNLNVGTVLLSKPLSVGDMILVRGHTTDFEQKVVDMQYEHKNVTRAEVGQEVGILVKKKVREGDEVFLP